MPTRTFTYCHQCDKMIGELYTKSAEKSIKLPAGDLDRPWGIWCGDIGRWIEFNDEEFCSFVCFLAWLHEQREEKRNE